ncbi:outer membrane beta-barrel protein [Pinibacter aurantiacus]|uniref:Outer membrane beta-barrel protein n=1 Tax=Pinibacter aurantiacus TaxID=2851599 RepID=A0A9E2W3U5_9BACT|nr:outer membrane beta-barrel protein [Pinibacter aurantiacus]MBV4357184.1 outer membrane beta-barrel protein [Pinibacter aurantiacus]
MKPVFAVITLFISVTCIGQKASIKGTVRDTLNKQNLSNAVIALLQSKDSVLYKFTRTNENGSFELHDLLKGDYLIMVTYPKFADYITPVLLDSISLKDVGNISLTTKAKLLEEVIVKQKIAAVRMHGDTLEFKADSFKVKQGANVEELLKQLPGISVDKDGKITAQGKEVEKILVDGDEFFGDDPTVATKNLQSDAVDKVQVFDKKSDQAAFTGIDDGNSKKTINLKLKEDKKRGYFGKLDLGGGPDGKYDNSAMFNRFRAKQKVSVYGIMSNVGTTGLNWNDRDRYGGGDEGEYNEDFDGIVYYGSEDNSPNFNGEGLPKSWAAGANYSDKFNADKQKLNGSYRYNKLNVEAQNNSLSQSILPDTTFFTKSTDNSTNSRQKHFINGTYDFQIDSGLSVKVTVNGSMGQFQNASNSNSRTYDIQDSTINQSVQSNSANGDNQKWTSTLLLRKKFEKIGRTLSLNLNDQYNSDNSTGYLNAIITTYDPITRVPKDSLTDQMKLTDTKVNAFGGKLSYTEPLSKRIFAEISYGLRINSSTSERLSYNKSADGKYEDLSQAYSNSYKYDVTTNTGGLFFKYNSKKLVAGIGSDLAFQNFNQRDKVNNASFERNYVNLFPRANFNYKFNTTTGFSINYNGSTRQPSIYQIQPVASNDNPLVIYVGNPLLKQQFTHSISFNYNSFKVMKDYGFYMYGNISTVANNITSTQYTDLATGKTVYQYINTNGNANGYMGGNFFTNFKKINMRLSFGASMNYSKYTSYVNLQKNTTQSYSPSLRMNVTKYKDEKWNISYNPSINFNGSHSTINTGVNNNYWSTSQNISGAVYIKKKFEIGTDVTGQFRQKTATFDQNNNVILWNGYLGYKLLKDDKAMIKFSAHDLLNQNKGYYRYISNTNIMERNYQTINRYFLLSFVWNFSKSAMTTPSTNP